MGIGILSCGVMSLRRSFCRRCPVGARGEHSRSDAESAGVWCRGGGMVVQNRYSRAARDVLRPGPSTPLMNESGHSHLCGWRLRYDTAVDVVPARPGTGRDVLRVTITSRALINPHDPMQFQYTIRCTTPPFVHFYGESKVNFTTPT